MAKLCLGPLGVNVSHPCVTQDRKPPERTASQGWSADAARRNRRFLQSVDPDALDGEPFALTLTTRDLPPTPEALARMIRALLDWLRRRGMTRYHWVIEWQERGAPHLHAAIFVDGRTMAEAVVGDDFCDEWDRAVARFPAEQAKARERGRELGPRDGLLGSIRLMFATAVVDHWCHLAAPYKAGPKGQHVVPVDDLEGWASYLSKHAIRGQDHYQRARGSLPEGWNKSGRLWAKGGQWSTREDQVEVDPATAYRFLRLVRRWQRSRAIGRLKAGRAHGNKRQIAAGRGELRHLARSGSGKPRPEALRLALRLLARARAAGRTGPALELLEQQVAQLRAEAADAHMRSAVVRGSSTMASDREVTRPLLDVALDHAEGYETPWRTMQQRRDDARRKARETVEAE